MRLARIAATVADGLLYTRPTAAWQWHLLAPTDSRAGAASPVGSGAGQKSPDPSASPSRSVPGDTSP